MRRLVPTVLLCLAVVVIVLPESVPALVPAQPLDVPSIPTPSDCLPAVVVYVVNGDTIDVEIQGAVNRVRYIGMDTPEDGQPCYQEGPDGLSGEGRLQRRPILAIVALRVGW